MDVVVWYSVAIGGPLATSVAVNLSLLTFSLCHYIAGRNLARQLSLRQIFPDIRPVKNVTWLDLIMAVTFGSANAVTMSCDVEDTTGFIHRSGVLSAVNMVPLFLGTQMSPIASGCGLSLPMHVAMHRWLRIMAILQGLAHAGVAVAIGTHAGFRELSDKSGIVIAATLMAIPLTSLVWRLSYETFTAVHFVLAVVSFAYLHTPSFRALESPKRYLVAAAALSRPYVGECSIATAAIRTITFEMKDGNNPMEDALHIHVHLARPWNVSAGQYVYLTMPAARRTSFTQSHPFYIAWWYRVGDDDYILPIAQRRRGFTEEGHLVRQRRAGGH